MAKEEWFISGPADPMAHVFSVLSLALAVGAVFFLQGPPRILAPVALGSMALVLALGTRRSIVMRFGRLTWTRDELCRHILITGDIGSGKTVGAFARILDQITRNVPDWGGLVTAAKGDEYLWLENLLDAHGRRDDLIHIQVRPDDALSTWKPPHRYNLLSDGSLPWMTHAAALVDVAGSFTSGKQHPFFTPMAHLCLGNTFALLDALGENVTLLRAHRLLSGEENLREAVEFLDPEHHEKLIAFFRRTLIGSKADEQREGIQGTVQSYVGFLLDPEICEVFSSDEENTFSIGDIDAGKILTMTAPQRFVTQRRHLNTYLKFLFYYHALRRLESPDPERNLLLFVADEFQEILTATDHGLGDHRIVDRVRSGGVAIIAGMQSEVSADAGIGRVKRENLALNMRTRFILRASDLEGARLSAAFLGKKRVRRKSYSVTNRGGRTVTSRWEYEPKIRAETLMELPNHTAVIVHPSKRWVNIRLRSLEFGKR